MSLKTYNGNCHCGQFRFQIEQPEITEYTSCPCSYCANQGYAFVNAQNYQKLRGELKEYRFASKKVSFQFCETCGTPTIVVIGDRVAINVSIMGYMILADQPRHERSQVLISGI